MQKRSENEKSNSRLSMSTLLITIGLIIVAAGLLWPYLKQLNLFHLPGDIIIQKENFSFYFPITTSILLSIVLSLLFWLINKIY